MTDPIGQSSQDLEWEKVQRQLQTARVGPAANVVPLEARAPWDVDSSAIKEAPRTYDPSRFKGTIGAAGTAGANGRSSRKRRRGLVFALTSSSTLHATERGGGRPANHGGRSG